MFRSRWSEATLAGLEAATSCALHQQQRPDRGFACQKCRGIYGWPQTRGKQHKLQLRLQVRAGTSASAALSVGHGNGNGSGSGTNSGGGGGGSGGSSAQHAGGAPLKGRPHANTAQTEEVILMDISGEAPSINC